MHHPELGGSTYDTHSDGSGVCHVSRRRPIVNVRPTGRLWNLFLDLCLLDWLEAARPAVRRRHRRRSARRGRGRSSTGYAVVLTGCHPEYYSREMLDALAGLSRPRRAAHVHGRQRLLLARLVSGRASRDDRGAAGRGRHPRLGGSGRRVLSQLHRRVRRDVAAAGPRARTRWPAWASSPRASTARPTTGAPPPAATRGRASSSRASRTRSSATSASAGSGAAGLELDAFNPSLGSPRMGPRGGLVRGPLERLPARQRGDERVVRRRRRAVLSRGAGRHGLLRASRAAGPSSPRAPSPTSAAWPTRATPTTSPGSP